VSFARQSLSALRRLGVVALLMIAFLFGLATTVYLSLRSPEVTVPEVVGKDRAEAERILAQADLNFRVRATRPSNQVQANTVLFQLPRAGDVVKAGQTVAMDISRTTAAGEASQASATDKKLEEEKAANTNTNTKNENENRPRRNRNANKNINDNENANSGTANRNSNANGSRVNANNPSPNDNRPVSNGNNAGNANSNSGRNTNQNSNRRPVVPKPSPKPVAPGQNDNR
jgi:beta-lactam-binding protein with PASTA domain